MTAARVPLPHWRTQSRPCRHSRPTPAVHSPVYLAAFARFPNKRLITVGKFERNLNTTFPCPLNSSSVSLGAIEMIHFLRELVKSLLLKSLLCLSQSLCSRKRCQRQGEAGAAAPRSAFSRGQSVWAAAEGRARRTDPRWSETASRMANGDLGISMICWCQCVANF